VYQNKDCTFHELLKMRLVLMIQSFNHGILQNLCSVITPRGTKEEKEVITKIQCLLGYSVSACAGTHFFSLKKGDL